MAKTENTTQETIDEAVALIATGHALGLNTPTPTGMTIWSVRTGFLGEEDQETEIDEGKHPVYPTEEAARIALANILLHSYAAGKATAPWNTHLEYEEVNLGSKEEASRAETWLASHTASEIVTEYYERYSGEWYQIQESTVVAPILTNYESALKATWLLRNVEE